MFIVNGEVWQVKLVSNYHYELRRPDGVFSVGCCNNDNKTIFINKNLKEKYFKEVLCHEISHAVLFSYKIGLTYEQEEDVVSIIANYGKEIINITEKVYKKLKRGYH